MKLERRIKRIEAALAREIEQRQMLLTEVFVLRAALIGITINADASGARHTAAKSQATDRLTAYLMASGYESAPAQEALELLEGMFYEIDAARTAAGHPPTAAS